MREMKCFTLYAAMLAGLLLAGCSGSGNAGGTASSQSSLLIPSFELAGANEAEVKEAPGGLYYCVLRRGWNLFVPPAALGPRKFSHLTVTFQPPGGDPVQTKLLYAAADEGWILDNILYLKGRLWRQMSAYDDESTVQPGNHCYIRSYSNGTVLNFNRPHIKMLSPSSGFASDPITITGVNFGLSQGTVTFSKDINAGITGWNDSRIACTVPEGFVRGAVVMRTANGLASNDDLIFRNVFAGVTKLACGFWHSMALKGDGTVWTWGWNMFGELGDMTNLDRNTPVHISGAGNLLNFAGGAYFTIAVGNDGTVLGWGRNQSGELGMGTYLDSNAPLQIPGLAGFTAAGCGDYHAIALRNDGTVWAWGDNYWGQLGDGTNVAKNTPVPVSGLSHISAIARGGYHNLAIQDNGQIWAWGCNTRGALGDGTYDSHKVPVMVPGLTGVSAIDCGCCHTMALMNDGTLMGWGWNQSGQLGDGTNENRNTPVQVLNLSGAVAVSGGWLHTIALRSDGTVWAWGDNSSGQLGDGTYDSHNTPVQVPGLRNIIAIAAGGYHNMALGNDGSIWTWGMNSYGQLGDGSNADSNIPVRVSEQ